MNQDKYFYCCFVFCGQFTATGVTVDFFKKEGQCQDHAGEALYRDWMLHSYNTPVCVGENSLLPASLAPPQGFWGVILQAFGGIRIFNPFGGIRLPSFLVQDK